MSRQNILQRLRAAPTPFQNFDAVEQRRVMVPMDNVVPRDEFIRQVQALSAQVIQPSSEQEACDTILKMIGDDKMVFAWDDEHIPLAGFRALLHEHGVAVVDPRSESSVRVGITGVDAALAATGSIVMSARPGRPREVSLLPYVHIALVREEQILPHFEAWIAQQQNDTVGFRQIGNHVIITGASRTADIGMELVLGAHGPAELHVMIMPKS